jgi:lipid II:glycine glycyltransferase (peptidoglycan interpeptide bridge formation enzyme)
MIQDTTTQQPQPSPNEVWGTKWDQFLRGRDDTGFMQSWNYAQVMTAMGWNYFDAFQVNKLGSPVAGGRVFIVEKTPGQPFFYMPDGPTLADDPQIARQQLHGLIQYADQVRQRQNVPISHLRIEPRWPGRPDFIDASHVADGWLEPRDTIYVDLTASEDEMLKRMKRKGRYHIKLAAKNGVTVVQDNTAAGFESFLELYKKSITRGGSQPLDSPYLKSLHEIFHATDDASLFFGVHEGRRIVAGLVMYFSRRATYFFTGSDGEYAKLKAPYLMTWEIMLEAKRRGLLHYDLYGIAPPDQPDHPYAGFTQFKTMFGGETVDLAPAMDFVFDQTVYAAAR